MNLEKRMLEGGGLLKHFLSHQDWLLDDESWQAVAERFAADAGASTARHVAASLSALSHSPLSDHELAQVAQALGRCH